MRVVIYILTFLVVCTAMSFSYIKDRNSLERVWIYEKYEKGVLIYVHKSKFSKHKSGIEFKENGILKVKQNSSWCGTEPIDYEIVTGSWTQINDSIINLEYKFWGGNTSEKRQIIELTKDSLFLKVIERK